MVARLVEATEPIEVKHITAIIYGEGGSRKTSTVQTADKPFTLAFDEKGISRAFGRKACMMFDSWADVLSFDADSELIRRGQPLPNRFTDPQAQSRYLRAVQYYVEAHTVNVDTVGTMLRLMSIEIVQENSKNGDPRGGLSRQGYGVLKSRFDAIASRWANRGQDVVLVAHQKENKKGEQPYFQPDIVGGSYNIAIDLLGDVVGYMCFDQGKRSIDFYPNDRYFAKTPPCGWGKFTLPDFAKEPDFLARLLAQAKESMGKVSGESAKMAAQVEEWRQKLSQATSAEALNAILPSLKDMAEAVKRPAWTLTLQFAEGHGWKWVAAEKKFVDPAPVAAPATQEPPEVLHPPAASTDPLGREPGSDEPEDDTPPTQFNKPKKARKTAGAPTGGAA